MFIYIHTKMASFASYEQALSDSIPEFATDFVERPELYLNAFGLAMHQVSRLVGQSQSYPCNVKQPPSFSFRSSS